MTLVLKRDPRGGYCTPDGRYAVCQGEAWTQCDAPHPTRLPRSEWRQGWRADSTYGTIKGEVCGGNEEHPYTVWGVVEFDGVHERNLSPDAFDTKREAVQWLSDYLSELANP